MDTQKIDRGARYAQLLALELRGAIEARQTNISEVAKLIGVQQPTLSRYFNLHREIPPSTACDICEAIGVDLGMIADRAYDRLVEELGAYGETDAEIVSLYTPPQGIPLNVAAKDPGYSPQDQLDGETGI